MEKLINNIKEKSLKFIKNDFFKDKIKDVVNNFFPNLNREDLNVIETLTIFTVDFISFKYGFKQEDDYYLQWQQNNCSDIKGVILLLLPFIDDKNNSYLLKKIVDLNHILYSKSERYISNKILDIERDGSDGALQTHFKYGNMGLSLLPFKKNDKTDVLLDLYPNNEKLIYRVIIKNFYGLLQTLDIINSKCYINWVNIQPLNLNNYNKSHIYIKTDEYFKSNDFNPLSTINLNYSGLWLGDFYNVIRNKFYEEGKYLKWFFFPFDLPSNNSKYLIQILNEMINLEDIINNQFNNFDDLDENEQFNFKKILLNVLTQYLNSELNFAIIRSSIYWFINNYSDKKSLDLENIYIQAFIKKKKDDDNDQNDEDEEIDLKNKETVISAFSFIIENHINHYWNFLNENMKQLIPSSFGKFLIEKNEDKKYVIRKAFLYKPFNEDNRKTIKRLNIKNIYNIAKSLSNVDIDDIKKWANWDANYISLDFEHREGFFNRVLFDSNTDWFNINKNYEREIKFNPQKIDKDYHEIANDYEEYKRDILREFKENFITIVFEELVSTGILNKFIPNLQITDKSRLPTNTQSLQKKRKENVKKMFKENKKEWEESYYYLTNDKFKYMNKIKNPRRQIVNLNDKYEEKEYFDIIAEYQEWTTFYAMNWISQISFFQHYIFHQVLYVTGATGQGKSTQVPKLLMYACKMYDYNPNANVICTQPRISPTVENATRIAEELGLPIEEVSNNTFVKIKTDNYYVQYKYEGGEHSKKKPNHLSLKIVTDGTLLQIIKSNSVLKNNNKVDDEGDKIEGDESLSNKYSNNNTYDIIIVDEAHEHNINMDIIIALAKQSCYFNNQVKLIIVSATMDDDEPIYRSYFKNINDKLLYPIKFLIKNPFFYYDDFFEPVYMDRRYHISPPGETTQYKVTEIYLEEDIKGINNKEIAKKAQLLGYDKIIEICNKSTLGEILFFCNGKNEILEAVEYLNLNMPAGNIALPFFAEMNKTYKEIITKINSKIYNIKNRRENIHFEWNETYIEDSSVPAGLYKRSVIIATNVAEASVTIPGLAFVIDNGYAKENTFNSKLNISKLIVDKISESSRLQRKGRVGRVSDGTVYYLYKKDARKDVKPKYKITQQDITDMVINLATSLDLEEYTLNPDSYKYKKLIVSYYVNPNTLGISKTTFKEIKEIIETRKDKIDIDDIKNSFTNKYLYKIYEKNYSINNSRLGEYYYNYYGVGFPNKIEYEIDYSYLVYDDGQLFNNLIDAKGQFYLIHPFENYVKRNVLNEIISYEKKRINFIPINEYRYFLRSLIDKNLIVDYNGDALYLYNNDIIKPNRHFEKTELATKIIEIKKDFELQKINDAITLISASAMNCLEQVLEIRIFLELIKYLPSNLIKEEKKWDNFKKIYTSYETSSDILFIYEIINKIKSRFSNLLVFNIQTTDKKIDIYIDDQIKKYKKLVKKSKDPPSDYDGDRWNKLRNLEVNGTLTSKKKDLFLKDSSTSDFIFNNLKNYEKEIESWAETNHFKAEIITEFIKKLGWFYLSNKDKFNNNKVVIWSKNFTSNFNKVLTDHTIEEKIVRSFVYGNPIQFTFNEYNRLKSTINFNIYDVQLATPFYSKKKMTDSLANVEDFIFYLNYEQVDDTDEEIIKISILSKIKPVWLLYALPLVHNPIYNDISLMKNEGTINIINSYTIRKLNKEFTNNWSNNIFVWKLSDKKVAPLMYNFYKSIDEVFKNLIH